MKPGNFKDFSVSRILHFVRGLGLLNEWAQRLHKRLITVKVRRSFGAHPSVVLFYSGGEGVGRARTPFILNLSTSWRWVVSFTPWPLYPKERTPVPKSRRLGGPWSLSGCFWRREKSPAHIDMIPRPSSQDSAVAIPTTLSWLNDRGNDRQFPVGQDVFLFSKASGQALVCIQPPVQWAVGLIPWCHTGQSIQVTTQVNAWSYVLSPICLDDMVLN